MKKIILILFVFAMAAGTSFAQETEETTSEPVYGMFESGILIDQQTAFVYDKKTLEFIIQHKFGSVENGLSDLYGIYAPGANVRLALNYVPLENLQIGAGLTKNKMYTDLNAKYLVFEQTQDNKVPVSVTLFGSMAIDGRNVDAFSTPQVVDTKDPRESTPSDIAFDDRLSYFSQLIISRKFTDWLSLQAGASFTHYNMVEWDYDHDVVGAHFNGRIKFSPQSSFIFNYDWPIKIKDISEQRTWDTFAEPNLQFGVEISTFTHAFQIFAGNANGIIPQDVMLYNRRDINFDNFAIGFTITRLWMY